MQNSNISDAWEYHNGTKHPNGKLLNPQHYYNFHTDYPHPFKEYNNLKTVQLSLDSTTSGHSALEVIVKSPKELLIKNQIPNLAIISAILYFSAGLTKKYELSYGKELFMRAASCTGALYHIELYLVCKNLKGLEAGIYHFDPKNFTLSCLKKGDFSQNLIQSTGQHPSIISAPAVLIFTDFYSRNAVKYQSREYRHAFWDCGTILAQTQAICNSYNTPNKIITGFIDSDINQLLQLNPTEEFTLALVPIGYEPNGKIDDSSITQIEIRTKNNRTIPFPAILHMHNSSSLINKKETQMWLSQVPPNRKTSSGKIFKIEPISNAKLSHMELEKVILHRGSTRKFEQSSISFQQLSTIFYHAMKLNPLDYLDDDEPSFLTEAYCIVHAVDGLHSGSYLYLQENQEFLLLDKGNFREKSKYLGFGQVLSGDSSITIFFLTNLSAVLSKFGNRGYRLAQLEGSIIGGRMYLSTYALKLGATGLTYLDDAVISFFSPHAREKSVTFMIAIGNPAKGKFHPGKLTYLKY